MERINRKDVERLVEIIAKGYPDTKLDLQVGSPTYGHAWRLNFMLGYPENHGLTSFPGLSNGYLGWSAREAYRTLEGILAGMEAQRLAQAETIRRANGWLVAASASVSEAADLNDLGSVVAKLDELAPPTEF